MALRTPPSWLQNGSHPAENDRLTTQAIWKTTGIINSTDLAVSASSPAAMSVVVASGWASILGTTQANMGVYMIYNDANTTLTVTTANPSLPRIDSVVATVSDAYYTGSLNQVAFSVIAGTPNASPTAPATPANSILLATIAVGAAVTSITSGNITDQRVKATSTISGLSANYAVTGLLENANIVGTGAASALNIDIVTSTAWWYTANATANFTLNFRGNSTTTLNSILSTGQTVTIAVANTNGSTAYYPIAFTIDGTSVTPKWAGGTAPTSGNASAIDAYVFTILKTGSATYTVIAQVTKFA
jgi:hypothetical protein